MLMLKHVGSEIHPQPNHTRHEWARWDTYINTSNPDALYDEYLAKNVPIHSELADTNAWDVRDKGRGRTGPNAASIQFA
jgi:hypothetical protein